MRRIVFFYLLCVTAKLLLSQEYSTSIPSSISQNYGSIQGTDLYFHNAVDIPMQIGDFIYAEEDGKVVYATAANNSFDDFRVYIQSSSDPNRIIGYTHINEEPFFPIYSPLTGVWVCEGQTVSAGDPLGTVLDPNQIFAKLSHPHVHMSIQSSAPIPPNTMNTHTCTNPLDDLYPNFVDNTAPIVGPMFIKSFVTGNYQRKNELEYLYGKIIVSREVIDHLGGEFSVNNIQDNDIWPTTPAHIERFDGYTSVPYRVEFGIRNQVGEIVYPSDVKGFVQFDNSPINNSITDYIYDTDKDSYTGIPEHQRNYCFRLTSLEPGNSFDDRYWNTALQLNAPWNGESAGVGVITESEYPDGKYYLITIAEDAAGNGNVQNPDEQEVIVDNFMPFVEKVEIFRANKEDDCAYRREWSWIPVANYMDFSPAFEPFYLHNNDNLDIHIHTSEAMNEVTLDLNGFHQTLTSSSNDKNTLWIFNISNANTNLGENQLIIDGFDYANNPMQLDAHSIPKRIDPNGDWLPYPNSGADLNHVFTVIENNPVDFIVTQKADPEYTIQFTDISTLSISDWLWDFGDGQVSTNQDPVHEYPNSGQYQVILTVTSNGSQYSNLKIITVVELEEPNSHFYFEPPDQNKNMNEWTFYDNSEGIISTWEWQLNNEAVILNNSPDPVVYSIDETNPNTVKLKVTNASGNDTYQGTWIFDPSNMPLAYIHDFELSYFVHDLQVSATNMDGPYEFNIDFGDGTSETFLDNYSSWHTFNHVYYDIGDFEVIASVKGIAQQTGTEMTVYDGETIEVRPRDFNIQMSYDIMGDFPDPYPLVDIEFTATILEGTIPGDVLFGYWKIYKIGDPIFYVAEPLAYTPEGQVEPLIYDFEDLGDYKVCIDVTLSGTGSTGRGEIDIEIISAPDYLDADICCAPYDLCVNSTKVFYAELVPIGNPNVPEEDWFPTDIRWTLNPPNGNPYIVDEIHFNSIYDYLFAQPLILEAEIATLGEYELTLESWNDQHNYATQGYLHPDYINTISFYDADIQEFTVTDNLAFIKLLEPTEPYVIVSAAGETFNIRFENPGKAPMYWTVEKYLGFGGNNQWFNFSTTGAIPICNDNACSGNLVSIIVDVEESDIIETNYGGIEINGYYDSQLTEPIQGPPLIVRIEQPGILGDPMQAIIGDNESDKFGYSTAIDGDYAVVGAPGGNYAKVLARNTVGEWMKIATLQPSTYSPLFGKSIDIHGEYVIVGANNQDGDGVMYIFKRPSNGWSGTINEIAVNTHWHGSYGADVAIWGDYAVVGATGSDHAGSEAGAAYVYFRNSSGIGDNWGLVKSLYPAVAPYGQNDHFGSGVDIYNDIIVVGAMQQADYNGYIRLYDRNSPNEEWGEIQTIPAPLGSTFYGNYAYFGKVVSIFEDHITVPFYVISSNDIHYHQFSHFIRNESGLWEEGEFLGLKHAIDPAYNVFTSVSTRLIYTLEEEIDKYYYGGVYGAPDLYSNTGEVFKMLGPNPSVVQNLGHYYNPVANDFLGVSLGDDPTNEIVGSYGYDNYRGRVIISRKANNTIFKDNCEALLDFSIVNFTKVSGSYPTVFGKEIVIGNGLDQAIIESGAEIEYQGYEVVMEPGFEAQEGSYFTATAYDCSEAWDPSGHPTEDIPVLNSNFNGRNKSESDTVNHITICLMDILKNLILNMKQYHWREIDIVKDIRSVKLANGKTIISEIKEPHPIQCNIPYNNSKSLHDPYLVIETTDRWFKIKLNYNRFVHQY
jgi:PKD repeat protein